MSSRTCPDWPELMELAPDLQFKHYTVAEAQLPAEALMQDPGAEPRRGRDLLRSRPPRSSTRHTDPRVVEALRDSHWYELAEWTAPGRPATPSGSRSLQPSTQTPSHHHGELRVAGDLERAVAPARAAR